MQLTPPKTLPKKQDYSPVIFQIALFIYKLDSLFKNKKNTYKLDSQNKNIFIFAKKKASPHARSTCVEASPYNACDSGEAN